FFQAEDGIRDRNVTGVQTCALPISGGILVTGAALVVIGLIVHRAGTKWIHAVMPPAVMGTILALIGLNLAGATTDGMQEVPLTRSEERRVGKEGRGVGQPDRACGQS